MNNLEIKLRELKAAINSILDHAIEDLQLERVPIKPDQDFYWDCPSPERYDTTKKPAELWNGRLSDDLDFVNKMIEKESYVIYMLTHIAPLLKYIAQSTSECGPNEPPKSKVN